MSPKISVIIPVYNVEKFLSRCLDSLRRQTMPDFEAVCIDDGSPDNCGKILEDYAAADSRFKVIHQPNKGLSAARNAAIPFVTAPYVMFVDSDDYLHPQALEHSLKALALSASLTKNKKTADILWFDYNKVFDMLPSFNLFEKIPKVTVHNAPFAVYAFKKKMLLPTRDRMYGMVWGKVYRTELVQDTPFLPVVFGEDNLFTAEVTAKAVSAVHLRLPLYYYYCANSSSITQRMNRQKIKESLRREIMEYAGIQRRILATEKPVKLKKDVCRHIAETIFFKRLFRPFIKSYRGGVDANAAEDKAFIDIIIKENRLDFSVMQLKYRLILWLYRSNKLKLCRWLCYF